MYIKKGNIIYEVQDDEITEKEVPLNFSTLWGLTVNELKEEHIFVSPNPSTISKNSKTNKFVIHHSSDTLLDGYIENTDTYIWVKDNEMILNLDNFDYTFVGESSKLISSVSDYKNGFLSGKEKLKEKIYEEDVERYYVTVNKEQNNKYMITIGKKRIPTIKEKKYEIFAENITEFMTKVKKCINDYLKSVSKYSIKKHNKDDKEEELEKE